MTTKKVMESTEATPVAEKKETTTLSPRVARLREAVIETQPRLSCERIRFLFDSYKESEGEPPVIRRAKLLEKVLGEMTLFIDENPIVGTQTQYRPGMQPYPEYSCEWMTEEADYYTSLGASEVTEEDRKLLYQAADYWRDKCIVFKAKQLWRQKHKDQVDYEELREAGLWINPLDGPIGRLCVDYAKVLNHGLDGVIAEAHEQLEKLPIGSLEAQWKRDFLTGVTIVCKAVINFAQRYAALAEDMAQRETNPERKKDLEKISETCRWVPAKPARTFYEAIQSFWFTHLATEIENCSSGHSPGRFSQYMYPFYKKDKEKGRITEEEAIELLELFFVKFTEILRHVRKSSFQRTMGSMFQNIVLGGVASDGKDATNELDFLLLEAQKRVRLIQPTLSVLYHDKLSHEFLLKCAGLVSTGLGMPAFFNNDVTIQRLLDHGASLEDARSCCIIGCVEGGFSHSCNGLRDGGVGLPRLLELALNNGRDPMTGKQIGLQTGEADSFQSYDELCEAIRKQLRHFLELHIDYQNAGHSFEAQFLPSPFISALTDDCIRRGQDMNEGGARYCMHGYTPVGMIDLADSLAAIKKLVFEDKRISMKQLLEALAANFEGHEELHSMLLGVPKFGNDDGYVDQIAKEWYETYEQEHQNFSDHLGRRMRPPALSVTFHTRLGSSCGALPSSRRAKEPFADASVSPSPGKDVKGPTALILSATKVIDTIKYASAQMNMKFHPSALRTREGLEGLIALVKTYMELGGHHIQFNVVSAETLRDAQVHPENYRGLIVRVAGFSAFFVHLDRVVQDEIIKRTELRFC